MLPLNVTAVIFHVKRKLLEETKRGKKRMKQVGKH